MDHRTVIKKHDAVLHGYEMGTVIAIYAEGFWGSTQISKKNRVLKIQLATGEKKMIWEANATKLDKKKFKKQK